MKACSTHRALVALVAAATIGLAPVGHVQAAPVQAALEIEVDEALNDHALIEQWLEEQIEPALAEAGVELGSDSPRYRFTMQVGGEDYDYVIRISRDGPDAATLEARCACSKTDVVAFAVDKLVQACDALEPSGPESSEVTEPDSGPTVPDEGPDDSAPSGARVGPLGITGIVALIGGTGAIVAGGVLLARGERTSLDGERDWQIETRDHRPAGRAALGVGVGVLALGVVFVTLDQTVLKRRRRAVAFTPAFGPHGAAIRLTGRF